jgi:3-oxoadipate enol-lactonase
MPYADINGQRIYYEDTGGSGPPVILAHGFLMDQSMFDPQVAALSPEFRVIRWDERIFGRTEWDGKPFTYWDSAADCIGLLDHLGIDRAVVGGMSQGGWLSLRAALARPKRVKALVLLSTSAHVEPSEQGKAELRQTSELWPMPQIVEMIAGLLLGGPQHWEPWIARWREFPKERLQAGVSTLLERDDILPRIGEITCPAIIVHGTADVGMPMALSEELARALPRCKAFIKVEGAAHAPSLTHPDQVNPPLLEFLRAFA